MYRDLKKYLSDSTEYNTLKINLGTYNFILRRNIYLAKKSYYANLFQKYKSDVKQTWSAIKYYAKKTIKAPQIIQTLILLIFFETLPHLLFHFN